MSSAAPFDRSIVRHYRNRSAAQRADHAFLFDWTAQHLIDRLRDIKRTFPLTLQIGARHDPALDRILKETAGCETLITADLSEKLLRQRENSSLVCDEEFLPFGPHSFDMVFSPFSLHAVNDLPGALLRIKQCLKPDGLFLAAFPGGDTLHELRQSLMQAELEVRGGVSPRVAPFVGKQQAGALMQRAGFALPVVDSELVTVSYENGFRLIKDLRGMGESNSLHERSRTPARRGLLRKMAEFYQSQFPDTDNRVKATFEIIFLIGWAPHASQQKPLRPGSASHRLADALDTKEKGTGVSTRP